MKNPFYSAFNTPYDSVPFDRIKPEHFLPAIRKSIQETRNIIDAITGETAEPDFVNTIERLEFADEKLNRISSVFFNLNSANTSPEIQKIAQEISPVLADFSNDIVLNKKLFSKINAVYSKREMPGLSSEQKMLLYKKYRYFVRNGAHLSMEDKEKLRKIDKELSVLKLKFSENVLQETQAFELVLIEQEIQGIPEAALQAARKRAEDKGMDAWLFTLDYPSYHAVVTYCENRRVREKMYKAYGQRAFNKNENNNEQIVLELVKLRHKRAQLLGYKTHADFVLKERMAENTTQVFDLLDELYRSAFPKAKEEYERLETFSRKDGIDKLQSWDAAFYTEKLKKTLFSIDDEALKPYFQLENVLEGVFRVAQKLYGLHFTRTHEVSVYHPEVQVYKVTDNKGNFVALFYADFFPRKGKRNGAWMTSYKTQCTKGAKNERPHVSIVCNFTKPTETTPSLLTFREVTTLFHEFGHALHGMLADTQYPSMSGTSVYWDFVELPSQVLENWAYEEEALALFAKHYQTGDMIPMEWVQKIKASANFMEGLATIRQLSFGYLDMAWHSVNPEDIHEVKAYEAKAFARTQIYPEIPETCMSTAFSHIFSGGYSSGYYSYKWAEVLDADAFEFFKEKGIFNHEVATRFINEILSKGGTEPPMDLYVKFRGKKPDSKALLRRAGLV